MNFHGHERSNPVYAASVADVVKEKTSEASGVADGIPEARAVVEDLLSVTQN